MHLKLHNHYREWEEAIRAGSHNCGNDANWCLIKGAACLSCVILMWAKLIRYLFLKAMIIRCAILFKVAQLCLIVLKLKQ